MKMKIRSLLCSAILATGSLMFASDSFALIPTPFNFTNTLSSPSDTASTPGWTYSHTLMNSDFTSTSGGPLLTGSQFLDISAITSALLNVTINVLPSSDEHHGEREADEHHDKDAHHDKDEAKDNEFEITIKSRFDDRKIGAIEGEFTSGGPHTLTGTFDITKTKILSQLLDQSATIELTSKKGTITGVAYSTLSGTGNGVVAPEPLSMILVGTGLAGLPLAGRIRKRFIKRQD